MSSTTLDQRFNQTTTVIPVQRKSSTSVPLLGRPARSKWQRNLMWFLTLVVVVGINIAFEPWKRLSAHSAQAASHSHSVTAESTKSVSVDRPQRATTANVVLPATFRPWQTTTLHARVSGYLKGWHRDLGDRVKAGELLAEIETPELDQELAEARALVLEATAAAVQSKAERIEAEAELKVAEAGLVRIRAEIELTKTQLERRRSLLTQRAVGQEEYDTFATQLQTRQAEQAASESDITRRRTNLDTRTAIIEAREATAKSRQSNVDRLQELQTFKRIVAPFDGVVTERTAEVGMLVTAGKEALFTVEDMSQVRVQINVPQTYATQIRPGVTASISIPESSVKDIPGTITRISESVDAASRTMVAEIDLANTDHQYQPGSYAQVSLTTPQNTAAWTIPTNTVSMRVEGARIAVVNGEQEIEIRPVTLGRDLGPRIVVESGIRGDERLVVNPGDDLTDGMRIRVHEPEQLPTVAQQ